MPATMYSRRRPHHEQQNRDSIEQAHSYFAQGHEVSFVGIQRWIEDMLVTMGVNGRGKFNEILYALLEDPGTPMIVRVAWNEAVDAITIVGPSTSAE